jgi:hypothetical protein
MRQSKGERLTPTVDALASIVQRFVAARARHLRHRLASAASRAENYQRDPRPSRPRDGRPRTSPCTTLALLGASRSLATFRRVLRASSPGDERRRSFLSPLLVLLGTSRVLAALWRESRCVRSFLRPCIRSRIDATRWKFRSQPRTRAVSRMADQAVFARKVER